MIINKLRSFPAKRESTVPRAAQPVVRWGLALENSTPARDRSRQNRPTPPKLMSTPVISFAETQLFSPPPPVVSAPNTVAAIVVPPFPRGCRRAIAVREVVGSPRDCRMSFRFRRLLPPDRYYRGRCGWAGWRIFAVSCFQRAIAKAV